MKRDLVQEHRELREALERLQGTAAAVFILPNSPELVDIVRGKLHRHTSEAIRVLDRVKPIPDLNPNASGRGGGRPPKHPVPEPGDQVGERTVVAILPASGKRADRSVEWRCSCGATGKTLLFNFRRMSPECLHGDVREARAS